MKSFKISSLVLIIFVVISLFFIIHNLMIFAPGVLERWTSRIAYPLLCVQKSVHEKVQSFSTWKSRQTELVQLIDQLKSERDELQAQLIEAEQQLTFANDIEEVATFKKRYYDIPTVLGQVIYRELSPCTSYIYVDAGDNKGIQQDMVAVYKHCLVGRVQEVYPAYCKVLLVLDPQCKVAATCAHTYATGIHEGTNGELSTLNYVSHLQRIEDGDMVVSSGQGTIFPRGFVLGRIKNQERNELYYHINVEPLLDFNLLPYCYIFSREQVK